MSDGRRWFDPSQPQTLQGAVLFSYLNGGIAVLSFLATRGPLYALLILGAVGANGIANSRRWGYYLTLVVSVVFFLAQLVVFLYDPFVFAGMLNMLFSVFLLALLLHPMSRSYQRLYFR